jgi:hypothetical protein
MSAENLIAFLTGQSRPGCCALSPEQRRFLDELAAPGRELVTRNFPYREAGRFREVPLLVASWRNLRGYYTSRRPGFAAAYCAEVAGLIARAERVVFLAGSSGLELFNNLGLTEAEERKCRLICYGPVARRLPRFAEVVMVQGSRDFLSRAFFRGEALSLKCGHMGYLGDPAFVRICREQLSFHASQSCTNISA